MKGSYIGQTLFMFVTLVPDLLTMWRKFQSIDLFD